MNHLKLLALAVLLCVSVNIYAETDTIAINSLKMNKTIHNIVVTPDGYSSDMSYPVVYMLHGYGDSYEGWLKKVPAIRDLATLYQVIIVCPDGSTSWYMDSPIDPSSQYETYITKELLPFIDNNYNTIKQRESRAITGLSMGGHGALYLAIKHRNLFANAGSLSGGVDLTYSVTSWDIAKKLGPYKGNEDLWHKNSITTMANTLNNNELNLYIDCGSEDFFIGVNRLLHSRLLEKKIAHDYSERPGGHEWRYWDNAIKYQMLYFSTKLIYKPL